MPQLQLPQNGRSSQDVLSSLKDMKTGDADWHQGRMFGLVYEAGPEVEDLVKKAAELYMIENALSPMAFPSLLKMETETVSMVLSLLQGNEETVGSVTSGGTESIFMAIKAARDWARSVKPEITEPEIVAPVTAHPAWNKAAHYLGLKIIQPDVDNNLRADAKAMEKAITKNTIALGGTAVTYPHGVVDPIGSIGEIAQAHDLWLHVDACLGGLVLPFLKKLDYPIPDYDFKVPGVTSISADIHKYAFTPKGVSTVLYRSLELRKNMFFAYADWPGGVYGTPCLSGARPGGTIAAAWAVLNHLGEKGFLELAKKTKLAADSLMEGINQIPGLYVLGAPDATVFSFGSNDANIYEIGSHMKQKGWHLDGQHLPASLHMTVSPVHFKVVDDFLSDLAQTVPQVSKLKPEDMSDDAALYGMIGTLVDRAQAKDLILDYLNDMYRMK